MTNNNTQSKFNQAFQPIAPLIEKMDYQNKKEILHNNINRYGNILYTYLNSWPGEDQGI